MSDKKTIEICGGYRLVMRDSRNWALQHYHASVPKNGRGDGHAKWHDTGNYFQTLGAALAFVFERRMREEGAPDEALKDAMERAEAIRGELMGVAK